MKKKIQRAIKHFIDLLGSLIGLIVLSPLFLVVILLIKLDSKGPVFFRQERIGKDEKSFKIWKFRTMVVGTEKIGLGYQVAKDDSRITKIGKFLREWTLDEFPQLINVL